jgi:hypothetical protein
VSIRPPLALYDYKVRRQTRPDIAVSADANRRIAATFQWVAVAIVSAVTGGMLVTAANAALNAPIQMAQSALGASNAAD